ncbi:MAG: SpoIIE family protein phosphatase [Bacteroidota bacterium]
MPIVLFRWMLLLLVIVILKAPTQAAIGEGNTSFSPKAQITLYKDSVSLADAGKTRQKADFYLKKLTSLYLSLKQNKEGITYFEQWLSTNPTRLQTSRAAATYNALGKLYLAMTITKKKPALEASHQAVVIYRKRKEIAGLADALLNEGTAMDKLNQTDKAGQNFEEALSLAKKLRDEDMQRTTYGLLAGVYKKLGRYKPSIEAMTHFTELDKKIRAAEIRTKEEAMRKQTEAMQEREQEAHLLATEMEERSVVAERVASQKDRALRSTQRTLEQSQRITRERQLEIENLRKADQIKELTLRKQEENLRFERYVRYSLIGIAGLIFIVLGIVYWSYRQKRKAYVQLERQRKEIQEQHDEIEQQSVALLEAMQVIEKKSQNITSSITYAQRIQHAILPDWQEIRHFFNDSFLLYRPRDIVSGDFFWFAQKNGKVFIAAVDCTGHGVPGAFISMAGHTWLNHIVNERGITQADEILNQLHVELRQALKQATTENQDGMDLALVVMDTQARTLEFAGAKNPLVMIQHGEIQVIKGDRHAIGGRQPEEERRFTRHVFSLEPQTHFYLFSDGFQDQFGGDDNQKFMAKRLYSLIQERHREPMSQQRVVLEEALDGWMNGHRQIDDVLMMGFRV